MITVVFGGCRANTGRGEKVPMMLVSFWLKILTTFGKSTGSPGQSSARWNLHSYDNEFNGLVEGHGCFHIPLVRIPLIGPRLRDRRKGQQRQDGNDAQNCESF